MPSLGADVHRDWTTLSEALGDQPRFDVRIGSSGFPRTVPGNFAVETITLPDVLAAYDWADCVIVPLKPNLHVSGVTVALEATERGKLVIATDVGGLSAYFCDDCFTYVPPHDPAALRAGVLRLRTLDIPTRVRAAQARLQRAEFTTSGYARRHVELSRSMLHAREPDRADHSKTGSPSRAS